MVERAWPGAGLSAGLSAPVGVALPSVFPEHVQSWGENTKKLIRAAVYRLYDVAGRSEDGIRFANTLPESPLKKKAKYELPESTLAAYEHAALAASLRDSALALLPLRFGFRAEELFNLRRVDVERAVAGGKDGWLRFVRKGGNEASLPSRRINDLLEVLLGLPAAQRHGVAERTHGREPWYTVGETLAAKPAKYVTKYTLYNRLVKKLALKAALPDPEHFTPHKLRHGFATRAMRAGIPMRVIQAWLGHASLPTTERYVQVAADDLVASLDLMRWAS